MQVLCFTGNSVSFVEIVRETPTAVDELYKRITPMTDVSIKYNLKKFRNIFPPTSYKNDFVILD